MKSPQEISDFVRAVCAHYSICLTSFICDYDEQYCPVPVDNLFRSDKVDIDTLNYLSEIIGMNPEDIGNTNVKAARMISEKYPFFELLKSFEECKEFRHYKLSDEFDEDGQRLLYRIFGEENLLEKYDNEELIERLRQQLIDYDTFIPGTYHPCAEITQFHYEANSFVDFVRYSEMMDSFLKIYDRMSSLFFKALNEELSQDEINEYNLFVSYFRGQECGSSKFLHYDILQKHRDIYKTEGYHDIDSYIKINRLTTDFEPWRCKQFAEYKIFAQRYQDIYPATKDRIRDFCMYIKYIWCNFVWSDAPYEEDEDDLFDFEKYQEHTVIYIPKTEEEIGDDATSAELLSVMASPESKGGLIKRKPEIPNFDMNLLMKRIELRKGGE